MTEREVESSQLFAEFRRTGDRTLRNRLVEDHLDLATRLARRYARRGEPLADLEQVAQLGLLKAVERYDPERGVPFAGFATPTITGELKRHFRDSTWSARVGRRSQELQLEIRRTQESLHHELGRAPRIAEVAERLGVSRDEVLEALEARSAYRARSLDVPAGAEEGSASLGEMVGDVDGELEGVAQRLSLLDRVARLPEREREIVRLRFEEELTQDEIAERLGMSQMHVSRLLRRTLDTLRVALE